MSFDHRFKARALAVLTVTLVFGSGLGIGLAVDRALLSGTAELGAAETTKTDESDEKRSSRKPRRLMIERVGLTVQQQATVDGIVLGHRQKIDVIRAEFKSVEGQFNDRYRVVVGETRNALKEQLTPSQRDEYEVLLAENDKRRREKRDRHDREHPIP